MSSQPGFIYLTWGQDPATSLIILWQTKSADNPKKVDYRPAGTDTWQHATGSSTDSPGAGVIHQVYLKGLLPGTVYEYRVSWDDGSMSTKPSVFSKATFVSNSACISAWPLSIGH